MTPELCKNLRQGFLLKKPAGITCINCVDQMDLGAHAAIIKKPGLLDQFCFSVLTVTIKSLSSLGRFFIVRKEHQN